MSDPQVAVGIVGAGFISNYHINGLNKVPEARIVAVSDIRPETARDRAAEHDIPYVFDDYNRMLDRTDIDAVVISVPDNLHEEVATNALKAGKSVLLQKPMAMSVDGCRKIIDSARTSGTDLQVSWMHRYFEEVAYTKEFLGSPRVGPVLSIRIRNAVGPFVDKPWYYKQGIVAGGAVLQLGVHGIDLSQYMFGPIECVSATTGIRMPKRRMPDGEIIDTDVEDHALAQYRYANGILGTHEITSCEIAGTDRFSMEIYCTNATLHLRGPRGQLAIWAPEVTGVEEWVTPDLDVRPLGARHHQWWVDILRGARPSDNTAYDGLHTQRVAEALYCAAESGTRQDVPPPEQPYTSGL